MFKSSGLKMAIIYITPTSYYILYMFKSYSDTAVSNETSTSFAEVQAVFFLTFKLKSIIFRSEKTTHSA